MATIPTKYVNPGDLARPVQTNNTYSAIATGTTSIDDANTRSEWASRYHFDGTVPVNNTNFENVQSSNSQVFSPLNSNYAQVNLGGTPMQIAFGPSIVINPGEVLRAHFDVNIDAVEYTPPASGYLNLAAAEDLYAFTLYWNVGGGMVQAPWAPDSYYSVSNMTYTDPLAPFGPHSVTVSERAERHRQRCNVSMIYINTTGAPVTVSAIEARVKIVNHVYLNSITLKDGIITAMVPRR